MHLHEELRRAREEAGLSQAEVAARAGIPRNQVVRAEKGENITLDTLRKIAVQLPLDNLTLLEKLKLNFDILPQPEKAYISSMQTIVHLTAALQTALQMAMTARLAMLTARRTEPLPFGEPGGDVDTLLLFKSLEGTLQELQTKLQETKIA
ncbi:MAG TPA: helix-turn-helix transcriptional regulator [Thermoanaerobaculia bacterium]|jgi:transcriptional regulator with XRE-family HTH domain|nr:helix-turn-helix transcriptional regulator [Thermoanaerobaculia bacterium]